MAYIVGQSRNGVRGGVHGFHGIGGLGGGPQGMPGSGNALNPYGGIGGGTEAQLRALIQQGLKFTSPTVQSGLVNGEKYIFSQASDNMFYKFKMTNTGWGNSPADSAVMKWFQTIVNAATPVAAGTGLTKVGPAGSIKMTTLATKGSLPLSLPGLSLPTSLPNLPALPSVGGMSQNTMLLVGGAALLGLVLLMRN